MDEELWACKGLQYFIRVYTWSSEGQVAGATPLYLQIHNIYQAQILHLS